MELPLPIITYITSKKMLFASKSIILNKNWFLWTDTYKSEILTIEMNTFASKWISTVKNKIYTWKK
jgi:hypothetical protein